MRHTLVSRPRARVACADRGARIGLFRRTLLVGLTLLTLLAGRAKAEIPLSDLRAHGWMGEAAASYLAAFNEDDAEALSAYVTRYRDSVSLSRTPAEVRVGRQRQYHGMLGALSLRAIREEGPGALRLIVYSATTQNYFELSLDESTVEAGKIGSQGMRPVAAPPAADTEGGNAPAAATLPELVEALRTRHGIPALAVCVVEADGSLRTVVRGVRERGTTTSVEASDRFHLGSIAKSMTASVIARLVEREELGFETKLGEALPDLDMHESYRELTLASVLQHRAGIEPLLDASADREARWRAWEDPTRQREALAADVLAQEPSIPPGSGMLYSNAGYAVAALVAERAVGKPWEELIEEELFGPLELSTAGLGWPATAERPDQPRGHWGESEQLRPQALGEYEVGGHLAPAGDVHMSVEDLARYGHAHLRGLKGEDGWLTAVTVQRLHAGPDPDANSGYAMGWAIEERHGHNVHHHEGSAGTFYAVLLLDPDAGRVVAVLMNDGRLANDAIAREIVEWLR